MSRLVSNVTLVSRGQYRHIFSFVSQRYKIPPDGLDLANESAILVNDAMKILKICG